MVLQYRWGAHGDCRTIFNYQSSLSGVIIASSDEIEMRELDSVALNCRRYAVACVC